MCGNVSLTAVSHCMRGPNVLADTCASALFTESLPLRQLAAIRIPELVIWGTRSDLLVAFTMIGVASWRLPNPYLSEGQNL
jgi:hypothetical protein